jgi:5-methylcytosine-specific restriction endonuclease McrA
MTSWGGRKYIPGQSAQRTRVLKRDVICSCKGCLSCSSRGCPNPSTTIDHTVPVAVGGSDDTQNDSNVRGLCNFCHNFKSKKEAANGRRKITEGRPQEKHPGIIEKF